MIRLFQPDRNSRFWDEAVVSIGTFDGVHLGHQMLLNRCVLSAREHGLPAIALTFDRNPLEVIRPEAAPMRIQSLEQNLDAFERQGIDISCVLHFDSNLASTSADEFLDRILNQTLGAKRLIVGHDFAFGRGRQGTPEWLSAKLETEVLEPLMLDGSRVSSSAIRSAVSGGDVASAARLLGRDFCMSGIVVRGQRIGRTIGYPTANLAADARTCCPGDGVYAGRARIAGQTYQAAIGVGVRPTVDGKGRTVEAFLIDYSGEEFYGQSFQLEFVKKLRDEQRFEDLEELKVAMDEDVRQTKELIAKP